MTDDPSNLKPAKPVAPRRRLPENPQMAQPVGRSRPPRPVEPAPDPEVELEQKVEREAEMLSQGDQLTLETAPEPPPPAAQTQPPATPAMAAAAPTPAAAAPTPLAIEPPETAPVAQQSTPEPQAPEFDFPRTMRETLARVDQAWTTFRAAAERFPAERMDERLSEDGWTRKQMLEHIAAWHDLTADRLVKFFTTNAPVPLDHDTDAFNASVARRAIGKTSGEVMKDMDATFNRLRRQMSRLTDVQLKIGDWWAAWVIGGNTYGHYEEHWAEIYTPELPPGARNRR
jgi:hypothetical protein